MKLKICNYFNVPLDFLIGISNVAEYQSEDFNKATLVTEVATLLCLI